MDIDFVILSCISLSESVWSIFYGVIVEQEKLFDLHAVFKL